MIKSKFNNNSFLFYKIKLFAVPFLFTLLLSSFFLSPMYYAGEPDSFFSYIESAAKEVQKLKEDVQSRIAELPEKIANNTKKDPFREMEEEVKKEVASDPGTWAVYVKNLKTGEVFSINPYHHFYAASLIKLYTMACAYEQRKRGELEWTADISSSMKKMITVSDNGSFNSLTGTIGKNTVNEWIKKNNFSDTKIFHGLYPADNVNIIQNEEKGSNYTSARDCGRLLELLYKRKCVNRTYSEEMVSLLKEQKIVGKIPAGVSGGTVANKTGETNDVCHDAAIVYGEDADYILVVLCEAEGQAYKQTGSVTDISKIVWEKIR